MTNKEQHTQITIKSIRKTRSAMGNPQWHFDTSEGAFKTWPNSSCAYSVTWTSHDVGTSHKVTYETKRGKKLITSWSWN